MNVLIVDDEASIRGVLRRWVEAEGASVTEAVNAEDGLSCIVEGQMPAVVFCDLRMPGKDGFWLVDRLRTTSPDTAVVMATGAGDFDIAVTSLRRGVVDYVAKPFHQQAVVEALYRAFAAHTRRRTVTAMHAELTDMRVGVGKVVQGGELSVDAGSIDMATIPDIRAAQRGS
jgi:DNA-binding NtrC family response regulator